MHFFNNCDEEIEKILGKIGKRSIDELFTCIPANMLLKKKLNIPKAMDEQALKKSLAPFLQMPGIKSFLGAGAAEHFVPEWVSQQLIRAEWYTPYTPYQPEVSQGNLHALFEFQTMVANLLGQPIANASMYDGATALAESIFLAHRVNKKKIVLIPNNLHPHYYQTVQSYLEHTEIKAVKVDFSDQKTICLNHLAKTIEKYSEEITAVVLQTPNFFGLLEDVENFQKLIKQKQLFSISVTTDISALAVLKPLGACGFDVSVADGIGFCGPIHMGGPSVGLFATSKHYLRQLPGRLVGQTVDKNNTPGFVLTLSTREQHIRRENATSNICTNHNLMALALGMTLTAYGKTGFIDVALRNVAKTNYLRNKLKTFGISIKTNSPHYNETIVNLGSKENLSFFMQKASKEKVIPGLDLAKFYPQLAGNLMICTTEVHQEEDIDSLAKLLSSHMHG